MHIHMTSQIASPKERFPAHVTVKLPFTIMFHHVHSQQVIIEEFLTTNRAGLCFLLIVYPTNVVYHEGVTREHSLAISAFVTGVVDLY